MGKWEDHDSNVIKCAKIPGWRIIRRIVTPRLKAPGLPVVETGEDLFLLTNNEVKYVQVRGVPLRTIVRSFYMYLKYAWRSGQLKTVLQFMTVGASGLIINLLILHALVSLSVSARLAGFVSTLITIFTNFLINDNWTFREHKKKSRKSWVRRLVGYYATSLGTFIMQVLLYEAILFVFYHPLVGMTISVGLSYIVRLVYIRDKVYS